MNNRRIFSSPYLVALTSRTRQENWNACLGALTCLPWVQLISNPSPYYSVSTEPCQPSVLVSYCGCNKSPQTWWLKATEIYSFTVPETWNMNQGVGRAALPPEAPTENPFLPSSSFRWRLVFTSLWQHHSNLCFPSPTAFSSSAYSRISLCLPLMRSS